MRPPKVDPKYAREIIGAKRSRTDTGASNSEPPKVDPKYAREIIGAAPDRAPASRSESLTYPSIDPKYAKEFVGTRNYARVRQEHNTRRADWMSRVHELTGHQFETLILSKLSADGFVVMHTPAAGDAGLDGILMGAQNKIGLQIKKQKSPVLRPTIQMFVGALASARLNHGVFITTSKFTKKAAADAKKFNILLVDGVDLNRCSFNVGLFIDPRW